jgi:hypothetical protein
MKPPQRPGEERYSPSDPDLRSPCRWSGRCTYIRSRFALRAARLTLPSAHASGVETACEDDVPLGRGGDREGRRERRGAVGVRPHRVRGGR